MLQICLKVDGQMRVTRSLIVLALIFLAGSFPEAFGQDADQDQAIMNVIVWNPVEARFYRRGTAFHVGNSIFYTNAHVVKKSVPGRVHGMVPRIHYSHQVPKQLGGPDFNDMRSSALA
jgi:hypothetical protein